MEFDQFEFSSMEIDRVSWMFDSLRCHGIWNVYLASFYTRQLNCTHRELLWTSSEHLLQERNKKKTGREKKKEKERCPGEKIRRFALSIRLFHKSESDLLSSFPSRSILNIPFGSVNRDIFIAAIRHSKNVLLCMYWLKFPLGSLSMDRERTRCLIDF